MSLVARVGFAPLSDTLNMGRTAEIIPGERLVMPTALAGGLARLAARGRGAVALAPGAARVGSKEGLTVLALAFDIWTSHWPASPQANHRKIGAWKEENGVEKAGQRRVQKTEEEINLTGGEEDGTA